MKKICMITTVSLTLKSFVVETAKQLQKECGYEVTLVCHRDDAFAASLPDGIRYIPVSMARGIDFSALSSVFQFIKLFRKERFDLVQYATPNASCYASIAARLCRVPIRLYCQWGIRYVGFSGTKRKIFKFLEKLVCRNSTHIRAVSPKNMQFAIEEGLYPQSKAKVVGNGGTIGVDLTAYDIQKKDEWRETIRSQYSIDSNDTVFGFVGRISKDKGCTELLSAFQTLCKEIETVKLLIVGPLEEDCGVDPALIRWAQESEKVLFTGKVENSVVKNYYAAMDALIHPTYREGFGMVIQEAGALAVPVLTTRIIGASEVMKENVSCLLAEPKNTEDLYEKMLLLAKDPALIKRLGAAALAQTEALYARPIMLRNQQADYQFLLEETK